MADFTMCHGQGCPLRMQCYRFRAVTYGRQDYFGALPYDPVRQACDDFDDIARLAPTEAQVRDRAYALWLASGRAEGHADAHWFAARTELEQRAQALIRAYPPA